MNRNKEYEGRATDGKSHYSDLNNYNGNNISNPIRAPVPLMVVPCEFNLMRPHNIAINSKSRPDISNEVNCNTFDSYRTLNTMCQ